MKTTTPEILFEDSYIIVAKKPSGVPTQTKSFSTPDMEKILKNYLVQSATKKGKKLSNPYLAVIHRLDQPVSGILVFAKDAKTAANLNRQLNTRGFTKCYLALVDHEPKQREGELHDYLVKDARSNTSKICDKNTAGAKKADLHYNVISLDSELGIIAKRVWGDTISSTLLEVILGTGRHHQIRVQLSSMGCPIEGDSKYGGSAAADRTLKLCAYKLEFHHPVTGKKLMFHL